MTIHLVNPRYRDALTACGEMAARRAELTTDRKKRTCDACRTALIRRGICPECGGDELAWGAHQHKTTNVADGRLALRDVTTTFYLGCEQCSETLISGVPADTIAAALTETGWRTP